jgi:hypothetical protein
MSKPIELDKLTQRKVTMPAILIVGLVILGFRANNITVDYLDEFFVTRVEAADHSEQITAQVGDNTKLLVSHISEYKLNENAKAIRSTENAIYNLELYVEANSESDLTRNRKRDLAAELSRLGRVRACIIRNDSGENCSAIL